jgi:hypothetical protein
MSDAAKKVKSKARDAARRMAKQMGEEPVEFIRSARSQVVPQKEDSEDLIGQIVKPLGEDEISQHEKESLEKKARQRIEELEAEIAEMRKKREEQEASWAQSQEEKMKSKKEESPEPLREPTTRPKRGMVLGGLRKKKQGTREIGKRPSG